MNKTVTAAPAHAGAFCMNAALPAAGKEVLSSVR